VSWVSVRPPRPKRFWPGGGGVRGACPPTLMAARALRRGRFGSSCPGYGAIEPDEFARSDTRARSTCATKSGRPPRYSGARPFWPSRWDVEAATPIVRRAPPLRRRARRPASHRRRQRRSPRPVAPVSFLADRQVAAAPVAVAARFREARPAVVVPAVVAERFPVVPPAVAVPVAVGEAFPAGRPAVAAPAVVAAAFPAWDACRSRDPGLTPYRARRSSGDSRSSSVRLTESPPA